MMDDAFGLTWEDSSAVVQTEEVICGMENEILPTESEEFTGITEEIVRDNSQDAEEQPENAVPVGGGRIMYLTDGNVLVMHQPAEEEVYAEDNMVVSEEVITDQWGESCPEEIIVGSEEAVGSSEAQMVEDCDIPLPTDQDEYTAARPYPCDFCSRRFRKKANLMNHMVAHQTDRPHGCNLCGVRYVRKTDLMNHLKVHAYIPDGETVEEFPALDDTAELLEEKPRKRRPYTKRKKKKSVKDMLETYQVEETATSTSRSYNYEEEVPLVEEIENSTEYIQTEESDVRYPITDPNKPFVCQHCGVAFAREKALASHSRIHAGDSPFECQKCGEMFWDVSLMREHARNKHGDMEDYDDDEDADYSEDEDTKYGTYYCSTCGLSFHRQDNLKRHQRVHVKEEFVNEHEFGHICNVCGESFQEALDLLAHAEIHARGTEHRCMICGETCPDEQGVAVHVQAAHGKNLPPHTCMLCGRTCKDSRALLKHSWEHSKEKVFACSKCAKTFHNKARLKRHMLSHRNKVVTCDVCGEDFPDGRSLMNHRHSHSSVSGRQFPCRECGKTFGSRSSQQIHIRIHTGERPYGCRFCWKAFADGGTLRKHERIHTGEKPYACAVCPRAFNQRVVLREHIRSHHSGPDPKYSNSMTPYCCAVCSDMFATSQDLILHLIHHCDMNTAMKRQPQVGPRKYKRRRKLKPHELEMISNRLDDEPVGDDHHFYEEQYNTDTDEEQERRKRTTRRPSIKKASPGSPKDTLSESNYMELYNDECTTPTETVIPMANSKSPPPKQTKNNKKTKSDSVTMPSRPKMIHTQKTRIPVDAGEDGRVRHKTKTLVTRTQPAEIKSSTGERIRPRTKNVSYHVLNPEKLPLATFPENEPQQAVENLLREAENELARQETEETSRNNQQLSNGDIFATDQLLENPPEVASEQTVETEGPVPVAMVGVTRLRRNSARNARNVIAPGSKVRLVKEGMVISKARKSTDVMQPEAESILPDIQQDGISIKQEFYSQNEPCPSDVSQHDAVIQTHQNVISVKQEMMDPSALHELAEISMQHANSHSLFKCEMCSEVFSDRAQLLVHVPIHI